MNEKLKTLREERKMSQQQVADLIGITQSAYSYLESGDKMLSVAVVRRLAREFKCTTDDIIGN